MLVSMMRMQTMEVESIVEQKPEKREKLVRGVGVHPTERQVLAALVVGMEMFVKHAKGEECMGVPA
eukprot:1112682-Amphidinium_carterae.1